MPTQAERTEATRARLVQTARRLFAEKGFAAASTEEILMEAEVSRGAMYHHFASKTELFQAVFEAVEDDLSVAILQSAGSTTDPLGLLQNGFDAFLDQCLNPEVQRIVMLDGPTVLGWDTWHEIDERYAFGLTLSVLTVAADQGSFAPELVEPMAHLMVGAVMQAGMVVARAADPDATKRAMSQTFATILAGL